MSYIDYGEIRKKYSKANELLEQFITENINYSLNTRDLYDFFDKNEIYITINPDHDGHWEFPTRTRDGDEVYFWININLKWEDGIHYKSRLKAEIVAFKKAFELLEEKLNKK
jgi:hypothetical protein